MAYCTATLVQARQAGRAFTATSLPSATQVVGFCEDIAAELDGILRARGYTIPVATAATSALKLLEHGNALGAAMLVEQSAPASPQGRREEAVRLYEEFKKALRTGETELDAGKDARTARVRYGGSPTAMFAINMDF